MCVNLWVLREGSIDVLKYNLSHLFQRSELMKSKYMSGLTTNVRMINFSLGAQFSVVVKLVIPTSNTLTMNSPRSYNQSARKYQRFTLSGGQVIWV